VHGDLVNAFFAKWINWWNNNPYCVAFMVHSWVTCTVVYHVAKNFHWTLWPLSAAVLVLAAWKEFYWDHLNEPNHNAWPQGASDFGGYVFGVALADVFMVTGT
jgi:hypothetical protein